MHGPTFHGDGEHALLRLAEYYEGALAVAT
jgi:hypothetical protein